LPDFSSLPVRPVRSPVSHDYNIIELVTGRRTGLTDRLTVVDRHDRADRADRVDRAGRAKTKDACRERRSSIGVSLTTKLVTNPAKPSQPVSAGRPGQAGRRRASHHQPGRQAKPPARQAGQARQAAGMAAS
jgi:hypothetical protein